MGKLLNVNHEYRQDACEALSAVMEQMSTLLDEAREAVRDHPSYSNWDAYVFRNLEESLENANPYNQSISSIIDSLNDLEGEYAEPIEAWGEEWADED